MRPKDEFQEFQKLFQIGNFTIYIHAISLIYHFNLLLKYQHIQRLFEFSGGKENYKNRNVKIKKRFDM